MAGLLQNVRRFPDASVKDISGTKRSTTFGKLSSSVWKTKLVKAGSFPKIAK